MIQELNVGLSRKKQIFKMEQGIVDLNDWFSRQSQKLDKAKSIILDAYQLGFKGVMR